MEAPARAPDDEGDLKIHWHDVRPEDMPWSRYLFQEREEP
jgi:hypothetical protein